MRAVKEVGQFVHDTGPTNESRDSTPGPELAIIAPTFNEHDNVGPVYQALCGTLEGISWEAIFVDDDS